MFQTRREVKGHPTRISNLYWPHERASMGKTVDEDVEYRDTATILVSLHISH
jgi:hypothetical protein